MTLDEQFQAQRPMLWALAYRMTGLASEADDIVQETFLRAIERPPVDTSRPWAPWLTRVAMNLARDRLRRRQRGLETYVGPWLPEPAPEAGAESIEGVGRLVLRESAGFAYLLALEVLTPLQRAVLVLRDVLDFSTREAAEALDASEGSIKTTLHRARAALKKVERPSAEDLAEQHREAMAALMQPLMQGDLQAVAASLARDVAVYSDAGGEFSAATAVVHGPERAARLFLGLISKHGPPASVEEVALNGTIGWFFTFQADPDKPRVATHQLALLDTDADGRVRRLYTVLASAKLRRWLDTRRDS